MSNNDKNTEKQPNLELFESYVAKKIMKIPALNC